MGRVIGHGDEVQCPTCCRSQNNSPQSLLERNTRKKPFLLKLMGYCLSKLRGFNPKLIGEKKNIYTVEKSVMKPSTIFFWILYLNAKLFSCDPHPRENLSLVWRTVLGWLTGQRNSLSHSDISQVTDFAPSLSKSVFSLLFDANPAHEERTASWLRHSCGHEQCWVFMVSCRSAAQSWILQLQSLPFAANTWMVQTPLSGSLEALLLRGCKKF